MHLIKAIVTIFTNVDRIGGVVKSVGLFPAGAPYHDNNYNCLQMLTELVGVQSPAPASLAITNHGSVRHTHLTVKKIVCHITLLHVLLPLQLVVLLRLLQEGLLKGAAVDAQAGEHSHQVLQQQLVN